jgi:membrane-associated phospholipid phosphatase
MTIIQPHPIARSRRSRFARSHPTAYLGVFGIVGALFTGLLVWIFTAIADEIPEKGTMVRVDVAVARWLEAHGTEWGESIFSSVSYLGAPVLEASVVAAILYFFWRRNRRDAIALAITGGGGVALTTVLKLVFHRGRPETATEFITHQSWSFPSGHAMNSMVCYGFLALLLLDRTTGRRRRVAIIVVAAILIGAIGFSRLYLGVHYLSDVAGGFIAGAAWLLVCATGYRFAQLRPDGVETGAAIENLPASD